MLNDQEKFQQMFAFSLELAHIQDVDVLLEKILTAATTLVNADAGTIYIKDGRNLKFSHTQNTTLQKRLPAGQKLIYRTFSVPVDHNSISGYVASTGEVLNIFDVYKLNPKQVSYAFDRTYDEKSGYRSQSMLTVPLKNKQKIVGVMQLINAQNDTGEVIPFVDTDIPLIRMFANNAVMALERTQMTRAEILGMIQFLTKIRDPEETEAHVNRVGAYAAEIYEVWARRKGVPKDQIEANAENLRMAAMLHDLGKLAIPANIREKPDTFTAEEYDTMKQHTIKGAQMLLKSAQSEYETMAAEIALNHHEYWNGSGYPGHIDVETGQVLPGYQDEQGKSRGKQGEEIPLFGRIVAVADVYDALSSRRAFRDALVEEDVLKIIKRGGGKHFDPEMVESFFACLHNIRAIGHRFPDNENGNGSPVS